MAATAKKARSTLWAVAHHTTTSLLWTVVLIVVTSCFFRALDAPGTSEIYSALIGVGVSMLVTMVATEHSMSYIRRRAMLANPLACVAPSIAVFAGVLGGMFLLPVLLSRGNVAAGEWLYGGIFFTGPMLTFCLITWLRFRSMPRQEPPAFGIIRPQRVEPIDPDPTNITPPQAS